MIHKSRMDIFADVVERVHNYKEISSIFFK